MTLSRVDVKNMVVSDLENKKTKFEFFHDGMSCPTCGYPVRAGDALYIIGGNKCCSDCKGDIIKVVRENL